RAVADARGALLLRLAFRPARGVCLAVAMDGVALPVSLAADGVPPVDRELHAAAAGDAALARRGVANLFRIRNRADLLFVAFLFHGHRRSQRRTRRPA